MGQKDGSQMRVPFGLDEHGNAVWADQIPYDRNGFKCGLVCPDPNCGKRLKAVRWSKDDPERGIHYLAHEANSRGAVESNPESLLHLEAKAVLKGLIGHDFYLPNLSLIDSVPHTSRYRNAGKLKFKKYGKLTVLPVPGSSVLKFGPETYKSFIPGTGCMTKIEDVKTERDCGAMCPEGLIPDAVALLSHADTEIWVAIEFRVSHPKAIKDVRKYATVDFPVMEISITDDIANAGDTRKSLAERITGTGHATRFAGREWLYSPAAKKILKRSWHIEAEPSDKPLRHKGTGGKFKILLSERQYARADAQQKAGKPVSLGLKTARYPDGVEIDGEMIALEDLAADINVRKTDPLPKSPEEYRGATEQSFTGNEWVNFRFFPNLVDLSKSIDPDTARTDYRADVTSEIAGRNCSFTLHLAKWQYDKAVKDQNQNSPIHIGMKLKYIKGGVIPVQFEDEQSTHNYSPKKLEESLPKVQKARSVSGCRQGKGNRVSSYQDRSYRFKTKEVYERGLPGTHESRN